MTRWLRRLLPGRELFVPRVGGLTMTHENRRTLIDAETKQRRKMFGDD